MQGERFVPSGQPLDSPLRNITLSELGFAYAPGMNTDLMLALTSIMNSFPLAIRNSTGLYPIKCDIYRSIPGSSYTAYATKSEDCYWVLFSEDFLEGCITNARNFVDCLYHDEPRIFQNHQKEFIQRLVQNATLEIVVQHELAHIKQGHVDYSLSSGSLGVSEGSASFDSLRQHIQSKRRFRQRTMEFVADEAGVGSLVAAVGLGNWVLAPREAIDVFDQETILVASAVGCFAFILEVAVDSPDGSYPSPSTRAFRLFNTFGSYANHCSMERGLNIRANIDSVMDKAHICLDVLYDNSKRGQFKGHQNFSKAMKCYFSEQTMNSTQAEYRSIANECRSDLAEWSRYKGGYVAWPEFVREKRL